MPLLKFQPSYITHSDTPQSVGFLWTSDQFVAQASASQHTTLPTDRPMPQVGFEPTISAGERPLAYALDRAATGPGPFYEAQLHVPGNKPMIFLSLI